MFKRALVILLVLMVLFSFTSVAFAGQGAEVVRDDDGKVIEIHLPSAAKDNANENSRAHRNPIEVGGP